MVQKKRKQKTLEEPNNKKVAKVASEDNEGNEDATQKITVEVLPIENEKQEVKEENVDTKEPKKAEGNGSQSSGNKKKKNKNANNNAKKVSNELKKNETESNESKKIETKSTEPKKSETESTEPKKNETVSNEPKKSETPSNEPKKRKTANPNSGSVDDYVLTKEDAEKLLGTLSKDELVNIVKSALKKYGGLASEIANIARKDPAKRKLFVRGLGWDTKSEALNSVFSAYGEIEKADIVMDKNSGKSKGFGFVTFKSFAGVLAALKEPSKKIDDRMTVCQLSTGAPPPDSQQIAGRKIYVGGLPKEDVDSDKLLKLFSQYGEIEEGPLGFDKDTGKSKGFVFFIFKSEKSAKRALEEPMKTFDGITLTCKTAPAPAPSKTKNVTPSKSGQVNMWPYSSPLGGYIPMGNFGSPIFQQAYSQKR